MPPPQASRTASVLLGIDLALFSDSSHGNICICKFLHLFMKGFVCVNHHEPCEDACALMHNFWEPLWPMWLYKPKCCPSKKICCFGNPPCMSCTHTVRLISSEHHEISWNISVSTANLGCFIQPSRCMCPLASLSCMPGELPLSRHRPSVRCREQSLDMPHVAGRQGEHFGWHKAWHSEEIKNIVKEREQCCVSSCLLSLFPLCHHWHKKKRV